MSELDTKVDARAVSIEPKDRHRFVVSLEGVELEDYLAAVELEEAIEHFGKGNILDAISEDEARAYWNIPDDEE